MSTAHILVVDDEPDIRNLVQEILIDEGYDVTVAENAAAARAARRARRPDLILLDIWMPDVDGITLLKEWQAEGTGNAPVIMMSGHGTVETAVEATRLGAYDFIEKPLSLAKLLLTAERALEADKLQRENVDMREHLRPVIEPLGKSVCMQQLREQIERVAEHDAGVLITGEPGSGKHQAALYLHSKSNRGKGSFIEVGVASITDEHSAVELFGSERNGKISYGRLEQANGGTLFFDDIADMDLATQGRLVSALDTGSFVRVGGSEAVKIDVRVIAASHHDLQQKVAAGEFRDDLYYQLSVVPVRIPALREHSEDIPELLNHFVDLFVTHDHLPYRSFSVAAQNRLRNYGWPGNIRELQNMVQRVLINGGSSSVELDEIEPMLNEDRLRSQSSMQGVPQVFDLPLREAREQFEKAYLEHRLQEAGGSVGKVAKLAGIERTHLYRKLRALGIDTKKIGSTDG
ncbi:sigma-54-dependent transcriptional regulator [Sulfuriflexus mobilis]|uniref:sigma-54-dependent transcriptional regulator n=1 Tax=Sulfuriflexus mobilis TaxID=1811807 RepID=UPI000F839294|nr:sigma-54 dependent transcriptional regulator [Sulfuriflexus mobilis]